MPAIQETTAMATNTWRPAHERSHIIRARYGGDHCRCRGCGARITAGDSIWYAKGAGARCTSCGRHPADENGPAAAAPATEPTVETVQEPTFPETTGCEDSGAPSNGNGHSAATAVQQLAEAIAEYLPEPAAASIDEDAVRAIAEDVVRAHKLPLTVEVKTADGQARELAGLVHEAMPQLVTLIGAGLKNILMVGPAGSGKTTLAGQAAEAFGVPFGFLSLSAGVSEAHVLGRVLPDASGAWKYQPSRFVQMYQQPGVFLFDELDAADPNVLVAINAALANGKLALPDGSIVHRDPRFVMIAAANTYGRGADMQYVGRNQLDAATLDRFVLATIWVDYSANIEEGLAGDTGAELLEWVRHIRERLTANKLRRVASTRIFAAGMRLLAAGTSLDELKVSFTLGWTADEKAKIA